MLIYHCAEYALYLWVILRSLPRSDTESEEEQVPFVDLETSSASFPEEDHM